jgi:putative sigma-54 modulation protein
MTVAVNISGHNMHISDRLKEYIEKKAGKLDHYLADIGEVRVDLTAENNARDANDRKVVQMTVRSRGTVLRAEERASDPFSGFDLVVERMYRQIERYKTKRRRRGDGTDLTTATAQAEAMATPEPLEEEVLPLVVRRKQFAVTPMTEAEAVDQMILLEHDNFFIFYNAETAKMNVLYKRKDGTLGLIEPEIG